VVVDPNNPALTLYRANVCAGMVNNLVPYDEVGPGGVKLPATIDFLVTTDVNIYLRLGTENYDTPNPVFPVTDEASEYYPALVQVLVADPQPVDTDEYCYILMGTARNLTDPATFTIDQMVSGSLWVDRIKMGAETAQYFWARV
jgi:hypothetical protein